MGLDNVEFHNQVKAQQSVQAEFLSKPQASDLISAMPNNGNAERPHVAPEFREPGHREGSRWPPTTWLGMASSSPSLGSAAT